MRRPRGFEIQERRGASLVQAALQRVLPITLPRQTRALTVCVITSQRPRACSCYSPLCRGLAGLPCGTHLLLHSKLPHWLPWHF